MVPALPWASVSPPGHPGRRSDTLLCLSPEPGASPHDAIPTPSWLPTRSCRGSMASDVAHSPVSTGEAGHSPSPRAITPCLQGRRPQARGAGLFGINSAEEDRGPFFTHSLTPSSCLPRTQPSSSCPAGLLAGRGHSWWPVGPARALDPHPGAFLPPARPLRSILLRFLLRRRKQDAAGPNSGVTSNVTPCPRPFVALRMHRSSFGRSRPGRRFCSQSRFSWTEGARRARPPPVSS